MNNPCIECGKQRTDGKSWTEKIGISIITHTSTTCPDAECQKIVDKAFAEKREKMQLITRKKIEAKLERDKLIAAS